MKITENFLLKAGFTKEPSLVDYIFKGHGILIWKEGKYWKIRNYSKPNMPINDVKVLKIDSVEYLFSAIRELQKHELILALTEYSLIQG